MRYLILIFALAAAVGSAQAGDISADWNNHRQWLDEAYSQNPQTAHAGWRKIAHDLESAHEQHPEHPGILKDLIVAYSQLNAFEAGTPRGSNLSELISRRIAEYKNKAGQLNPADAEEFHKALALLYFQNKLYPLAIAEAKQIISDPQAATLKQALAAIEQAEFTQNDSFEVPAGESAYKLAVYQPAKDSPSDQRMAYQHWYFIPQSPWQADVPSKVWYSLSSQVLTQSRRYYLYGHCGNQFKILMVYGSQRPEYQAVKDKIRQLMTTALTPPEGNWLTGRRFILAFAAAALAVVIVLRMFFSFLSKRRRTQTAMGIVIFLCAALAFWTPIVSGDKAGKDPTLEELIETSNQIGAALKNLGISHPRSTSDSSAQGSEDQPSTTPAQPAALADPLPLPLPASAPKPAETPVEIRSEVVRKIIDQDINTVHHVQTQIAEAVVAGKIKEEVGRKLFEAVSRLSQEGTRIRASQEARIGITIGANLSHLIQVEEKSSQAAGGRAGQRGAPPREDISAALASEAFGDHTSYGSTGSRVVVDTRQEGTKFFARPDAQKMDDVAPLLLSSRGLDTIYVPPPRAPQAQQGTFVAKGVKILIDDAMLADVLQKQGANRSLAEIETLEDTLLAAGDVEDAAKKLQEYTEAKKTAFLQIAQQSRNLDNARVVSLKKLLAQAAFYRDRWSSRPQELLTIGGLTRIHGFISDHAGGDLLIVGSAMPDDPLMQLDDLIVGLRSVWRDGLTPGCSLDSEPAQISGPQYSRVVNVPSDSHFARVMLDADYAMKLILLKVPGNELGIPGFNPLEKFADSPQEKIYNRFWLFPVQPTAREIQLGPGGGSVLFDSRVQVLTETMAVSERGVVGIGTGWSVREHDARMFTQHYDQIAGKRPVFKELRSLFDIVTLGKVLRITSPQEPLLAELARLPYQPVNVPKSYAGVQIEHNFGARIVELSGGCDIRKRMAAQAMVEARTGTTDVLAATAQQTAGSGALVSELAGGDFRLPQGAADSSAPAEQAYIRGLRLLNESNPLAAQEEFSSAIDLDNAYAAAYAERAVARFKLGWRRDALWDAAMAMGLDRRDDSFRATYYWLRLECGIPEALEGIDENARKELAERYYLAGRINEESGDKANAAKMYSKALDINPRHADALVFRGLLKQDDKDYQAAINDFTAALGIDANALHANLFRGACRFHTEDYRSAIEDYTAAIKIDPEHALSYSFRANAEAMLEKYDDAIEDATAAIRLNPAKTDPYFIRAGCRINMAKQNPAAVEQLLPQAAADLEKVLEIGGDSSAYSQQARQLLQQIRQTLSNP